MLAVIHGVGVRRLKDSQLIDPEPPHRSERFVFEVDFVVEATQCLRRVSASGGDDLD